MKLITGYISDGTDWNWDDPNLGKLTHLNYAFATVKDKSGTVTESFKKADLLKKVKNKYKDIRICLSIGGWGAGNFSEAAETEANRKRFASTAIKIMEKYQFDGLDIDWEYPCDSSAEISSHYIDKVNFTLLLKEIRESLDEYDSSNNKKSLLTIAAGAHRSFLNLIEPEKIIMYLDYLYLMSYDFGSGSFTTGHHAPLYYSTGNKGRRYVSESVDAFLKAGINRSKLILGVPFYGRGWKGVEKNDHGLSNRVYGERGLYIDYSEIKSYIKTKENTEFWDNEAKAPYYFDGDLFITYENNKSLEYKIDFIQTQDLGGVMFWEYALDCNGELLGTLWDGIKNPVASSEDDGSPNKTVDN